MRRLVKATVLAALLVTATLGACSNGSRDDSEVSAARLSPNATVNRVVDGDTVDMIIDGVEERVRLIGIDTPETKKENTPIECFGLEATAFTQSLLPPGTEIYLERDVEARDVFGRLLAYAYLVESTVFVNLEIVRQGYAQPLTIPPNVAHSVEFVEAARTAERADLGLWAECSG